VETHCIDCHGEGITKGGLDLGAIVEAAPEKHWEIWEHAILRMDTRQMPPPKKSDLQRRTTRKLSPASKTIWINFPKKTPSSARFRRCAG